MAIYVDKLRDWGWTYGKSCHLLTDGPLEELHAFAARLGLRREWFQSARHPHYDLTASRRGLALKLGAVELDDRNLRQKLMRDNANRPGGDL